MKTVIGIDVGGSTTKIVGFSPEGTLMDPMFVRADDPLTSIYGAFGKFASLNHLALSDIDRVMATGVGSTYITQPIYNLPCETVNEFGCIGLGGLYLTGLDRAIVVSMGTGTAITYAQRHQETHYLGGTGVGGGTVMGLSKLLLGMENIQNIVDLAKDGDLHKIDLRIGDMTNSDSLAKMPNEMTAANFGNVSELSTPPDIALGIINMVYETVGMCALFNARAYHIRDIVLVGNLTTIPQAESIFRVLSNMFGVNFIIPENAQYGPVIGAALSVLPELQ